MRCDVEWCCDVVLRCGVATWCCDVVLRRGDLDRTRGANVRRCWTTLPSTAPTGIAAYPSTFRVTPSIGFAAIPAFCRALSASTCRGWAMFAVWRESICSATSEPTPCRWRGSARTCADSICHPRRSPPRGGSRANSATLSSLSRAMCIARLMRSVPPDSTSSTPASARFAGSPMHGAGRRWSRISSSPAVGSSFATDIPR